MAITGPRRPGQAAPRGKPVRHADTRTPLPRTPLPPTPRPATKLAPTPVRAPLIPVSHGKPRVGFLNWSFAKDIEKAYCGDLYMYFANLAERREIDLKVLGRTTKQGTPFPPLEEVKAAKFDAIVSNGIWNHDYLSELAALKIPVVSCDHDPCGQPFDAVIFDGISAGVLLGKILLEKKHTDVLFFTRLRYDPAAPRGTDPFIEDPTYLERKMGVQRALVGSAAEFWPVILLKPMSSKELGPKVKELFERITAEMGHWPTIVIAPDSGIAEQARKTIIDHNLEIPRHISLAAFHAPGPTKDEKAMRSLSHVTYNWVEMAENAWKMLRARLAGVQAPPKCVRLQAQFVDGGTVAERRSEP